MIQNLCRSLTAAVIVCAAGVPLTAQAEQPEGNAHANLQGATTVTVDPSESELSEAVSETAETTEIKVSNTSESVIGPTALVSLEETATQASTQAVESADEVEDESIDIAVDQSDATHSEIVPSDRETALSEPESVNLSERFRITDHTLEGERIAIFYVGDMPVLTFVDQSAATPKDAIAETSDDPVLRAETFAQQIDEFHRAAGDPNTILVRWEEETEEYVMTLNGEPLVAINDATRYFNTTEQHHTDALHATNRLRVLMGGTDDLTEIEGAPEPEPVAVQADWGVTSAFTGQASWYGPGFHGRQTASGERFNQNALTAAHRTLPFGTRVRVTNVNNNRYVVVRINDRGPFSHGRVIDLSAGAAREIGLDIAGVGPVRVEVLTE